MPVQYVDNPNGHCRLCTDPDKKGSLVECSECDRWFHCACVGLKHAPKNDEIWICQKCHEKEEKIKKLEALTKSKRTPSTERSVTAEEMLRIQREAMEALVKSLKGLKSDTAPGTSQATTSNQTEDWTIYLKRQALADLPKFDGTPKDWPKFKKSFDETTKAGAFTKLENLNRLQKVLRGNAEKTVNQLLIDPENVPKIMERLEETFGRPDLIYNELLNELVRIRKESKSVVPELSEALDNLVSTIKIIDRKEYLNDHRLVDSIVKKLPYSIQLKWAEELSNEDRYYKDLSMLNEWLKPFAKASRLIHPSTQSNERKSRVNIHQDEKKKSKCVICEENHQYYECEKFKKMNIDTRRKLAAQKRLCFGCLGSNHQMKDCDRAKTCSIDGCSEKHSRWLHNRNNKNTSNDDKQVESSKKEIKASSSEKSSESNQKENIEPKPSTSYEGTTNYHKILKNNIYYQIVPVTLKNKDQEMKTYAFLDAGSSVTLIEEEVANELGLEGRTNPLKLTWTQNVTRETESRQVQVSISGPSKRKFTLKNVRTIDKLQLPMQSLDMRQMKEQFDHLKDLPIASYAMARPSILIGLDNAHLLMPMEKRMGDENTPMAMRTKLGWILFGNVIESIAQDYVMTIEEDNEMRNMMKQYFSTEDFGVKPVENLPKSKEEKRAENIITDTLKYVGNKYEIGMLFKEDNVQFPDSYRNAERRLIPTEKMLEKNEKLKEWAIRNLKEYVEKGNTRKLIPTELMAPTRRVYYLPHFFAMNPNKKQPRLVFDAKAEVKGVSRDCDASKHPEVTQAVKNFQTKMFEHPHPVASKAIIKQHNVDNYLDNFRSKEEAMKTVNDLNQIGDKGGFVIKHFISNQKLLKSLPQELFLESNKKDKNNKESQVETVLGLNWKALQIQWTINLPTAPRFGSAWELSVRNIKTSPKHTFKSYRNIQTEKGIIKRAAAKIAVIDVSGERKPPQELVNKQISAATNASEKHIMINQNNKITKYSYEVISNNEFISKNNVDNKVNNKTRKAADANFSVLRKINQLDIDIIKEPRDKHQKLHPPIQTPKKMKKDTPCTPCTWAKALLLSVTLLSIMLSATPLRIQPINKDGLIFHHEGTCLVQRGVWTTKIETNITPKEDIKHINIMHKNLTNALNRVKGLIKDDIISELTIAVEQQCNVAIEEIQAINQSNSRTKRSKGIFGFMKDLLFGGDDLEDQLQEIRKEDNLKLHNLSSLISNIEEKTNTLKTQLSKKLYGIHEGLDRLTKQYNSKHAEIATKRLLETIVLVRQIVESILNRYKIVKLNPISESERLQILRNIEGKIPHDCIIPTEELASHFKVVTKHDSLQIIMKTTIVNRETFELFRVVAIPRAHNRSIIEINNPYIAINHHEQYFYTSGDLVKLNDSYFISQQKTFFTEPDCIASAILHKLPQEMCKITKLKNNYFQIIQLSHPNVILYYAQNPREILIHCSKTTITPPHYAAIIYMDPECEIRTKNSVTYASSSGETRSRKIFFKGKEEIPHQIDIQQTIEFSNITEEEFTSVSTDEMKPKYHHHWLILTIIILSTLLVATIITVLYYLKQGRTNKQHEIEMSKHPQPQPRRRVPLPKPTVKHSIEEEDSC